MMRPTATLRIHDDHVTLAALGARAFPLLAGIGLAALALAAVLGAVRGDGFSYFFHSYLTNYCFVLSIALGALFFVLIQHATRAGWSVAVRRISEILAANVSVLLVLFLPVLAPVLLGSHALYEWTSPAAVAGDHLLEHKSPYLNVPFFGIRCVFYFAVWWLITRFFLRRSVQQDHSGDASLTLSMERFSGPALLLFAVTVTFAAFDWLMSLEPRWFSTIYGIYYFSGAILAGVAAIVLAAAALQASGRLTMSVTAEHYHDLGKLLFGFVIFWGYIAFSQYMLIWYANIPEETVYYLARQTNGWAGVSLALAFGHLLVPFVGLLPRSMKRRKGVLAFWCVWLLVFHWLDMYWLVMPNYSPDAGPPFGLIDVALLVGLVCLYLASAVRVAGGEALVPIKDPRLGESLALENF
ncbi:MAG: quinol:cytochrome C oxidoreductase [Pirellulales bacterium]|nr:quinol:cytochrome C oxidoreductase [Pirellulales bacterium]